MTKRFAHVHKLTQIRRDIQAFPYSADNILRIAIIAALPDKHKEVLEWAWILPDGSVTSRMVVGRFKMSQQQASDALRELSEFGLLEREINPPSEHRWAWVYRVKA